MILHYYLETILVAIDSGGFLASFGDFFFSFYFHRGAAPEGISIRISSWFFGDDIGRSAVRESRFSLGVKNEQTGAGRGHRTDLARLNSQARKDCCCCCCCLHIKSRSGLYSVLFNIRTRPTDANAFRGHRLTTMKKYLLLFSLPKSGSANN